MFLLICRGGRRRDVRPPRMMSHLYPVFFSRVLESLLVREQQTRSSKKRRLLAATAGKSLDLDLSHGGAIVARRGIFFWNNRDGGPTTGAFVGEPDARGALGSGEGALLGRGEPTALRALLGRGVPEGTALGGGEAGGEGAVEGLLLESEAGDDLGARREAAVHRGRQLVVLDDGRPLDLSGLGVLDEAVDADDVAHQRRVRVALAQIVAGARQVLLRGLGLVVVVVVRLCCCSSPRRRRDARREGLEGRDDGLVGGAVVAVGDPQTADDGGQKERGEGRRPGEAEGDGADETARDLGALLTDFGQRHHSAIRHAPRRVDVLQPHRRAAVDDVRGLHDDVARQHDGGRRRLGDEEINRDDLQAERDLESLVAVGHDVRGHDVHQLGDHERDDDRGAPDLGDFQVVQRRRAFDETCRHAEDHRRHQQSSRHAVLHRLRGGVQVRVLDRRLASQDGRRRAAQLRHLTLLLSFLALPVFFRVLAVVVAAGRGRLARPRTAAAPSSTHALLGRAEQGARGHDVEDERGHEQGPEDEGESSGGVDHQSEGPADERAEGLHGVGVLREAVERALAREAGLFADGDLDAGGVVADAREREEDEEQRAAPRDHRPPEHAQHDEERVLARRQRLGHGGEPRDGLQERHSRDRGSR
mmetsp:Transcript_22123/g.68098  ORF Transcript_22123/g.68098 Transcript_22123/m.68098 type:complete len:646 (+) Transcript_22123:1525-3462(+)